MFGLGKIQPLIQTFNWTDKIKNLVQSKYLVAVIKKNSVSLIDKDIKERYVRIEKKSVTNSDNKPD